MLNPNKLFRFEYRWPCSSCYTEANLRHLADSSKSLSFNDDRFAFNAHWMGITKDFRSKKAADSIEHKYFVDKEPSYDDIVGSALTDMNSYPFFKREGNWITFTIRAIFAGRGYEKRAWSLRESCDAKCFMCGETIKSEVGSYVNAIRGGVILDFDATRYEALCEDCYWEWAKTNRPWLNKDKRSSYREYCLVRIDDQISFTRFVARHKMAEDIVKTDNGERAA